MAEITKLVLINRAFAMMGEDPLESLDDITPMGAKASLIYDTTLAFCLGLIPWTFTRQSVELNRVEGESRVNGYRHQFIVPKGFYIKPNRLLRSHETDDVLLHFEYEGDRLWCNEKRVWAQLVIEQHPERWSGTFTHAFTTALAAGFVGSIAEDAKAAASLSEAAFGPPTANFRGGFMGAAIQADGRTAPSRHLPYRNPLLDAWSS